MVTAAKEKMVHVRILDCSRKGTNAEGSYSFGYLPSWRQRVIDDVLKEVDDEEFYYPGIKEVLKGQLGKMTTDEPLLLTNEHDLCNRIAYYQSGYLDALDKNRDNNLREIDFKSVDVIPDDFFKAERERVKQRSKEYLLTATFKVNVDRSAKPGPDDWLLGIKDGKQFIAKAQGFTGPFLGIVVPKSALITLHASLGR
jgi:hypothetical protein